MGAIVKEHFSHKLFCPIRQTRKTDKFLSAHDGHSKKNRPKTKNLFTFVTDMMLTAEPPFSGVNFINVLLVAFAPVSQCYAELNGIL
jgi:hypothetical protein